ncbi:MAG TPA: T9SS type A sorting domain-containing protein [Ignavibacteria bacterium]|nr:T9SS type A sorting domain-containing protein [Ignavibacteria bacterium]
MKKTVKLLFTVLFVAISLQLAQAQLTNLTYTVRATNFTYTDEVTNLDPNVTGNGTTMEFDIYIQQTNVPANDAEIMRFALGQYYINVNWGYNVATPTVADTAGFANFIQIPGSTTFTNPNAVPTNVHDKPISTATDGGSYYPDLATGIRGGYLNMNSNVALGSSSDVQISSVFPGTKVGRFRLTKNVTNSWPSPYFGVNGQTFSHLRWRVGPAVTPNNPNPVSKIFAYNGLGGASTEVTNKGTFVMDTAAGQTFPVELANFTASSNRNNVNLSWSTVREINNAGFDVERKLASATEWAKVGYVAGNGNTEETRNFTYTDRINGVGVYNYRLKQIDFNGTTEYFNLSNEIEVGVPSKFDMSQNYPNPFNPSTKINYDLPKDGQVSIALFDLTGRQVASLVNDFKTAGYYTVQFNATNLSSGMYFYRITADNFVSTKKMVLIK